MKRNVLLVATSMIIAIAVLAALRATAWQLSSREGGAPTLAPLLERVTPAVVNIAVVGTAADAANPLLDDPFLRRFFEGPSAPAIPPSAPRQSIGSGVIIDGNERLVVTNHHVIQGADSIIVTLNDRREYTAALVGSDAGTDIALLKVMADDTPFTEIPMGDSNAVAVGDYVVAIGNPFGLGQTATAGIVSAMGRSGVNIESFEDFIQTDASINPGNSGGALVDINGRLLGVNTAILSGTGGNIGIGFAIPSNMVREVVEQLLKHGDVQRGRIGIAIQEVDQSLAQSFGLQRPQGALVASVERGGPADKAGLKTGDVILTLEGKPIERSNELPPRVANLKPGTKATFEIWRDRKKVPVTVGIGELKPDKVAEAGGPGGAPSGNEREQVASAGKLGLALRPLSPEERRQLNGSDGLVVEEASGVAASAGIRAGDVVAAINGVPVKSIEDVRKLLPEEGKVAVLIRRGDASLYVPLDVG